MIRSIAVAAFALAVTTSLQPTPVAPLHQAEGIITQVQWDAVWAGYESMVSA